MKFEKMLKRLGKYGTDARYPYWSGNTLDQKFINQFSAIGLVVTYGAIAIVHGGNAPYAKTIIHLIIAIVVALFISLFIKHNDLRVQYFIRAFVCGLPVLLNLYATYLRLFL